ncbi:MAG: hypothetical protein GX845_06250, partial [Erysipelothrix sp.]|nr:hypothetical protein [Erysipelothrix sp.]
GDIPENTTVIKYKVKLKDTAPAGVHDTNEYAKLQYIDPAGEEVSENFPEPEVVAIRYVAESGGTVTRALESLDEVQGNPVGSKAIPNDDYLFVHWTDKDGIEVSDDAEFIPVKVNDKNVPATYYAHFVRAEDVTIKYVARLGGEVSENEETLAPVSGVAQGSEATALIGYEFVNWTDADDNVVETYAKFVPVKVAGVNVAATYYANFKEKNDVTINYEARTGGSVDPAFETLAPVTDDAEGSEATAAAGYVFVNWTDADDKVVGTEEEFVPERNDDGLNFAATYYANFEEAADITINYVANLGGSVDPKEETLAPVTDDAAGSEATAAAGYVFVNWTDADDKVVGTDEQFVPDRNDDGLNFAATYYANFEEEADITINYVANLGGSVDPEEESLAPATGKAQGSYATPNAGYEFVNWVDADDNEVGTNRQFIPSKNDEGLNFAATYYANFKEKDDVTINYEARTGGSVNPESETLAPVTDDAAGSEATAAAGYVFVNWTDADDNVVGTDEQFVPDRNDEGLNYAATYYANFKEENDVTINYEARTGGSVNPGFETLAPVTDDAEGSEATAAAGYVFVNWTDADDNVVGTDEQFIPERNAEGLNFAATYYANFEEKADITIYYIA